ncbi:MAG: four helix bundle protein [Polyangiaceae bacterium]
MDTFRFQKLDVYVAAKELAVLIHQARISDAELRDQATRAAKSCFLNLAEGLPSRQLGVRRRHFTHALGSLAEVCAAIELASAIGIVDDTFERSAHDLTTRIAQLIHGLTK